MRHAAVCRKLKHRCVNHSTSYMPGSRRQEGLRPRSPTAPVPPNSGDEAWYSGEAAAQASCIGAGPKPGGGMRCAFGASAAAAAAGLGGWKGRASSKPGGTQRPPATTGDAAGAAAASSAAAAGLAPAGRAPAAASPQAGLDIWNRCATGCSSAALCSAKPRAEAVRSRHRRHSSEPSPAVRSGGGSVLRLLSLRGCQPSYAASAIAAAAAASCRCRRAAGCSGRACGASRSGGDAATRRERGWARRSAALARHSSGALGDWRTAACSCPLSYGCLQIHRGSR